MNPLIIRRISRTISLASTRSSSKLVECLRGYENLSYEAKIGFYKTEIAKSVSSLSSLMTYLNSNAGALSLALSMKSDLLQFNGRSTNIFDSSETEDIRKLEESLKNWLTVMFSVDVVDMKIIDFDTASGTILEKVARGEAVHRVRSLGELKRRLHDGRRCYGLFHKSLPTEPVAFLHVAFTSEIAPSLR